MPWRLHKKFTFYRYSIKEDIYHTVWQCEDEKWISRSFAGFFTKEEAMADMDAQLIKEGYVLLTEEQTLLV